MLARQGRQPLEPELGRFGRDSVSTPPDLDGRQQVEGFTRTVSQPGIVPNPFRRGPRPVPDFRRANGVAATREWWRDRPADEPDLIWQTAPVPTAADTTFTFAGSSAALPENAFPSNQATLYADDTPVITFDLGQRERRLWVEGPWALEFIPKVIHTPTDGYHRQFEAGGCTGLYRLAAPSAALRADQALQLKVVLEPSRADAASWFAVIEREDMLEVSPRANAEQIEQLQEEVLHLKQLIGNLSRRNYPELFPERLSAEEVIIHTDGRRHIHPPDVELLANGDLLVCFREASEHLSCDGQIVTVRSADGGRTWGDRRVVFGQADTDLRDASIARMRDGTLLMSSWPNGNYDHEGRYQGRPSPTYRGMPSGIYIGRSADNGQSWNWQTEQPLDPAPFQRIYTSERILELPSGELLMANYFVDEHEGRRHQGCALYGSEDRGTRWHYRSLMADVPGIAFNEPALTRTRTGRLIGMLRNDTEPMFYQVVSDDEGRTWSPPLPSGIPGLANPASLLPLPDGTVLCLYGSRRGTKGLYVVASYDDGATWDLPRRRVIRDDFPNWDIGYPSSVLLPDGRVLAVYYFNMFERYFIAGSLFRWEDNGS